MENLALAYKIIECPNGLLHTLRFASRLALQRYSFFRVDPSPERLAAAFRA
jgi:hypothetical protein